MAQRQEDIIDTQDHVIERLEKAEQVTDVVLRISKSVSDKIVNLIGWAVIIGIAVIIAWSVNLFKLQEIIRLLK
jgi:hypothetical protein